MLLLERAQNEINVLKASECREWRQCMTRKLLQRCQEITHMQIHESFSGEINGFSTKQNLRSEQLETSLSLMSPLFSMELHLEQEGGGF